MGGSGWGVLEWELGLDGVFERDLTTGFLSWLWPRLRPGLAFSVTQMVSGQPSRVYHV